MRKYLKLILFFGLIVLIGIFSDTTLCVLRRITGLPCPSCGMTRAFLNLFTGDIQGAFFMHPLFFLIPLILLLFMLSYTKNISFTKTYIVIGVVFIVVYIIRMILYFPHTAPMDYEYNSIIGWLLFK